MVTVFRHRNVLYYASHNQEHDITSLDDLNGQTGCLYFWLDAPQGIRQQFRDRPDFWAIAPPCIAQQWMENYHFHRR